MIKKDIIERLYEAHGGMTYDEAEQHTNAMLELLTQAIVEPESVTVAGFGRFRHKKRPVREVIMPDGSKVLTTTQARVQFLPSPKLKAFVNSQ